MYFSYPNLQTYYENHPVWPQEVNLLFFPPELPLVFRALVDSSGAGVCFIVFLSKMRSLAGVKTGFKDFKMYHFTCFLHQETSIFGALGYNTRARVCFFASLALLVSPGESF